jgi:hypothetical protein
MIDVIACSSERHNPSHENACRNTLCPRSWALEQMVIHIKILLIYIHVLLI